MPIIDGRELRKAFSDRTVLSDVTLTIRTGERVGLVGNSGCGKSTLGRILARLDEPDHGEVSRRRGAKIEYLAQEPTFPSDHSVRQIVIESLDAWNRASRRHEEVTAAIADDAGDTNALVDEQAAAGDEVERLGGWHRLHEAEAVIGHLGISDASRSIGSLSGGEKRRVALARLLVAKPDLAILDEPTNHLDVDSIEWLEKHLRDDFPGALLMITHDRYVLDAVCTRTLELHDGQLSSYSGGYADYLEAKSERQAHEERIESNRQNFLRRELAWLRTSPKARSTKQKARIGRAMTALEAESPREQRAVELRAESSRQGKTILRISGLTIERAGRLLIDKLDLELRAGERIGVVGANGTGKTSLLMCLLGRFGLDGTDDVACESVVRGEWDIGKNTRIGYLDQGRDDLDNDASVRDAVAGDRENLTLGGETLRVGSYLERFLFDGPSPRKRISVLSGGERARVCLARLLAAPSNLLLLDEPTNDLDVSTLGALESMLLEYAGSALIVSHDRWFMDRVATSILAFEADGKVDLHRGNYSDYRDKQTRESLARTAQTRAARAPAAPQQHRKAKAAKKLSFAEQRELDGLIEAIESAESDLAGLESQLADPNTYSQATPPVGPEDKIDVAQLTRARERAVQRVAELTNRWEELEAKKATLTAP
jgi:ATP-binding cassette subfamily F protein uup